MITFFTHYRAKCTENIFPEYTSLKFIVGRFIVGQYLRLLLRLALMNFAKWKQTFDIRKFRVNNQLVNINIGGFRPMLAENQHQRDRLRCWNRYIFSNYDIGRCLNLGKSQDFLILKVFNIIPNIWPCK